MGQQRLETGVSIPRQDITKPFPDLLRKGPDLLQVPGLQEALGVLHAHQWEFGADAESTRFTENTSVAVGADRGRKVTLSINNGVVMVDVGMRVPTGAEIKEALQSGAFGRKYGGTVLEEQLVPIQHQYMDEQSMYRIARLTEARVAEDRIVFSGLGYDRQAIEIVLPLQKTPGHRDIAASSSR